MQELLQLEDFSNKVLEDRQLKGDVFVYVKEQLRRVCRERKRLRK